MAQPIDPRWLGERLRTIRKNRNYTLSATSKEIGVSVATLSRIERGEATGLKSDTLLNLAEWMEISLETFSDKPSVEKSTPDVVELHLRADKHLNPQTAESLANLFRTVYNQLSESQKRG